MAQQKLVKDLNRLNLATLTRTAYVKRRTIHWGTLHVTDCWCTSRLFSWKKKLRSETSTFRSHEQTKTISWAKRELKFPVCMNWRGCMRRIRINESCAALRKKQTEAKQRLSKSSRSRTDRFWDPQTDTILSAASIQRSSLTLRWSSCEVNLFVETYLGSCDGHHRGVDLRYHL